MEDKIKAFNNGSNMLEVAREYTQLGWGVLPVNRGEKAPGVKWGEYQERKPTKKELNTWFKGKSNKDVGITLVTGEISGVTIIDVDNAVMSYGIKGDVMVRSGGGGKHFYYQYEKGIPSKSKHGGFPVDTKSDGGVIVLPPTIHPKGNEYRWETFTDLPKFPKRFWEKKFGVIEKETKLVAMTPSDFGRQLVEFYKMDEGDGRNERLVAILGRLRRYVTSDEMFAVLGTYIANTANNPLGQKEVTAMLSQARDWESPEYVSAEIVRTKDLVKDLVYLKQLEALAPSTGYKGLDQEMTGFLPGNVYVLSGETNAGKTQVAINFAYNIAKQDKGVLYIALEPQERILNYLCSIDKNLPFADVTQEAIGEMSPIVDKIDYIKSCSSLDELRGVLEGASGYSMIIIDHIGYFVSGGAGDALGKQQDLMKRLPKLAREKECAVMAIAHVRKKGAGGSKKRGRILDGFDISGSGSFIQDATDVLIIRREFEFDELDSEDNRFKPEGGIVVNKTKSPQEGATGYAHLYFTPESALIIERGPSFQMNEKVGITPEQVRDIFKGS